MAFLCVPLFEVILQGNEGVNLRFLRFSLLLTAILVRTLCGFQSIPRWRSTLLGIRYFGL